MSEVDFSWRRLSVYCAIKTPTLKEVLSFRWWILRESKQYFESIERDIDREILGEWLYDAKKGKCI